MILSLQCCESNYILPAVLKKMRLYEKMALSAALLAFAMMGCSETGLDNSSSTAFGETLNENASRLAENPIMMRSDDFGGIPVLQKVVSSTRFEKDYDIEDESGYYALGVRTGITYKTDNTAYFGYGRIFWGKKKNLSEWEHYKYNADFAHVFIACVEGCRNNGNSVVCDKHLVLHDFKSLVETNPLTELPLVCPVLSGKRDNLGVVFTGATVLNAGKSDELVMQGSAYTGNLSYDMALRVYRKYIYPLQ